MAKLRITVSDLIWQMSVQVRACPRGDLLTAWKRAARHLGLVPNSYTGTPALARKYILARAQKMGLGTAGNGLRGISAKETALLNKALADATRRHIAIRGFVA